MFPVYLPVTRSEVNMEMKHCDCVYIFEIIVSKFSTLHTESEVLCPASLLTSSLFIRVQHFGGSCRDECDEGQLSQIDAPDQHSALFHPQPGWTIVYGDTRTA